MVQSQLEIAHFGGWSDKGILGTADSPVAWGDPMIRNVELTPTDVDMVLTMPESSRVTVGAEYNVFVFNEAAESTGSLFIRDSSGDPINLDGGGAAKIIPETSGDGNMMTLVFDGSSWFVSSPFLSGQVDYASTYEVPTSDGAWPLTYEVVDLYQNTANVDAHAIAESNGYSGQDDYRLVIRCHSMTIGSAYQSLPAFTTGTGWGTGCSIHIELINSTIAGYGGYGGSQSDTTEVAPQDGGDAIHAYIDLLVIADDDSRVTPGGGGGPTDNSNFGGGGGNGGNMTEGGATRGSVGGSYYISGVAQVPPVGQSGFPGSLVAGGQPGGSPAMQGGSWGAGVTGTYMSSTGGKVAASDLVTVQWSASPGFRWGNNGTVTSPPTYPSTVSL